MDRVKLEVYPTTRTSHISIKNAMKAPNRILDIMLKNTVASEYLNN